MSTDVQLDFDRRQRIGLDEAIFCAGKSVPQIVAILEKAAAEFPDDLYILKRKAVGGIPGAHIKLIWFFKDVKRARKANSACDLAVNLRRGVGRNPPQGAT